MVDSPANTTVPLDPFALISLPSLNNTFGAVQIGTFLGLILYGFTLHQSYRYFRLYKHDSITLKALVGSVLILETFNTILSMHICYYYLTISFFNPQNLLYGIWSIDFLPLSSALVIIASQSQQNPEQTQRIILVGSKYMPIAAIAIFLLLGELGVFTAATVKAFTLPTFFDFRTVTWFISAGSAMAVTADLLLTTVLIISLRRSRTGIQRTDSMIDVLILYSINTGLITGVFNILSFLFSLILPYNLIYAGFGIVGTKLYANTLLAALNARQSLAARGMITFGTSDADRIPTMAFNIPRETTRASVLAENLHRSQTGLASSSTVLDVKADVDLGPVGYPEGRVGLGV